MIHPSMGHPSISPYQHVLYYLFSKSISIRLILSKVLSTFLPSRFHQPRLPGSRCASDDPLPAHARVRVHQQREAPLAFKAAVHSAPWHRLFNTTECLLLQSRELCMRSQFMQMLCEEAWRLKWRVLFMSDWPLVGEVSSGMINNCVINNIGEGQKTNRIFQVRFVTKKLW